MVKMTLSEGQILTLNFDIRGHISTFRAKNTPKSWSFQTENNSQTTSEQLQTNFQNPLRTGFLTLKMVKMALLEGLLIGLFSARKVDIWSLKSKF